MCTRMHRRAYANVSALFTFTNVPANACTKERQCAMSMNASANASVCVNERVHGNVLVHSPLLRCLRIQLFPNYSPRQRREGRGEQLLSHWWPERQVAVKTWRVRAVSVKQQLQRPTTERVLVHIERRSHLSLLGNCLADQFMCVMCTPTLREVIMVKIVHIIFKFFTVYFGYVYMPRK